MSTKHLSLFSSVSFTPRSHISPVLELSISWSSPSSDALILAAGASFISRCTAAAKARGLDYKFIYQNYAAEGQRVFDGYGETNKARLIEVSEKYDPEKVFQKLQPGYFKLDE